MKRSLTFLLLLASVNPALSGSAGQTVSRVYVSAYPCMTGQSGRAADDPEKPIVTLYDRIYYGDVGYRGFNPDVEVEKTARGESEFYFDLQPGNYDAFVKFPNLQLFFRNGPLIVIADHDRHLFIAGCGLADWHDVAAVAGRLPLNDVTVSVLVYGHPMRCGDDIRTLDQKTLKWAVNPQRTEAIIDGGAYYANFHGYGKQNHTVALAFSGALFTEGAILLTNTPDTSANKPPFIMKDITPEIVLAATRASDKLICIPGF